MLGQKPDSYRYGLTLLRWLYNYTISFFMVIFMPSILFFCYIFFIFALSGSIPLGLYLGIPPLLYFLILSLFSWGLSLPWAVLFLFVPQVATNWASGFFAMAILGAVGGMFTAEAMVCVGDIIFSRNLSDYGTLKVGYWGKLFVGLPAGVVGAVIAIGAGLVPKISIWLKKNFLNTRSKQVETKPSGTLDVVPSPKKSYGPRRK